MLNSDEALRLAKDKVRFKHVLQENGIPTPHTYHEIHDFSDIRLIEQFPEEFVVKPAKGSGGNGIVLLKRDREFFVDPSGDYYSANDIKRHIRSILDGDFSGYMEYDIALIEERIYPSKELQFKDAVGLSDIRIICYDFVPVMAMLRYPTVQSHGRSNLHQGALGFGISLDSGAITYVHSKKEGKEFALSDLNIPLSFVMPKWQEMKSVARESSELANLRLSGVDIILNSEDAVMVLEINGRPGLEIQNMNENSLLEFVKKESYYA
ncbi:MAG: ATP-grasp domain-containing protein [Chloroflexi bacterium]|nr:ATP-grasp domain-containing protein [Chloroflexota bacterium]